MIIGIWVYFTFDIREEYYDKKDDNVPINLLDNDNQKLMLAFECALTFNAIIIHIICPKGIFFLKF